MMKGIKVAQDALFERQGKNKKIDPEISSSKTTSKSTLFKGDSGGPKSVKRKSEENKPPEEGSVEYWNEQRIKLGLKPLRTGD